MRRAFITLIYSRMCEGGGSSSGSTDNRHNTSGSHGGIGIGNGNSGGTSSDSSHLRPRCNAADPSHKMEKIEKVKYETDALKMSLSKIATMLQVGFGEAGRGLDSGDGGELVGHPRQAIIQMVL